MSETPVQLTFDLPPATRRDLAAWVVSEGNRAAFELVMRWPDWPSRVVLLIGPEGAGKSHLAGIFAERAGAAVLAASDLSSVDPLGLAASAPLVIEDAGPGVDERALFHLLNAFGQADRALLITARRPPAGWNLSLADLASRLRAATPVELAEPDDHLLEAVLEKLFADRQCVVEPAVVNFLARRMVRSFAAAHRLVDALDRAALAAKGPITRAVAARVLAEGHDGAPRLPGLDEGRDEENNPS
ncbi:hypothetical protein EYW49_12460 [Siculibacillus lacustris]|uniref:Uncharacterized protein n=1 Tax=Siculibacillus lacustris TaxID=1549641 RepID=A0A4Q9VMV2_9HYPH|nr:DnaA/Hda family protein [Siculibacillus lacustris]TBW36960.1 hypothetical protein EYW49_12460 [Siculibacillus lacustris]